MMVRAYVQDFKTEHDPQQESTYLYLYLHTTEDLSFVLTDMLIAYSNYCIYYVHASDFFTTFSSYT
jgi:metal-responsive CopG/Arc/MetJ family transcriptional regulator